MPKYIFQENKIKICFSTFKLTTKESGNSRTPCKFFFTPQAAKKLYNLFRSCSDFFCFKASATDGTKANQNLFRPPPFLF
jgi:hypothetical protein